MLARMGRWGLFYARMIVWFKPVRRLPDTGRVPDQGEK